MRTTILFLLALSFAAAGCGRSEYQAGFDEGYAAGKSAGGTRGLPAPEGRSAEYGRGFLEGFQKGLRDNVKLRDEFRAKEIVAKEKD